MSALSFLLGLMENYAALLTVTLTLQIVAILHEK